MFWNKYEFFSFCFSFSLSMTHPCVDSCRCMIVLVFVCMQDCDMITAECGCWFLLLLCFVDLVYEYNGN